MRFPGLPRALPLLAFAWLCAGAGEETQVDWTGDWDAAFRTAKERNCPVMVCINSKDGEKANDATAREIYHDADFVALSRRFVMVPVSVLVHSAEGACPRFGRISCHDHGACYRELASRHGEQFAVAGGRGEMISPQHAFFRPDGTLLRRKEYWLAKQELMEQMNGALAEVAAPGTPGPGEPGKPEADPAEAPLSEKDRAELERLKSPSDETRRAALGNLLSTGKRAAVGAVVDLLPKADEPLRCAILRALGRNRCLLARVFVEEAFKDKSALVRSYAAVALEEMAQKESIEALLKRVKAEGDTAARRNAYRALGVCGGGAADKEAAKALLKGMKDKQQEVGRHAALALRHFEGPAAELVRKPLEQAALAEKSRELRGAMVYALAKVGSKETTIPVLRKILADSPDEMARGFVRRAITVLEGTGGDFGEAAWWLFREDRDDPARKG